MITVASQEIKRRGIGIVDRDLQREPVHVIRNNRPAYVILREEDYQMLMEDLSFSRVTASEVEIKAGRFSKGTAADLMRAIDDATETDR